MVMKAMTPLLLYARIGLKTGCEFTVQLDILAKSCRSTSKLCNALPFFQVSTFLWPERLYETSIKKSSFLELFHFIIFKKRRLCGLFIELFVAFGPPPNKNLPLPEFMNYCHSPASSKHALFVSNVVLPKYNILWTHLNKKCTPGTPFLTLPVIHH